MYLPFSAAGQHAQVPTKLCKPLCVSEREQREDELVGPRNTEQAERGEHRQAPNGRAETSPGSPSDFFFLALA